MDLSARLHSSSKPRLGVLLANSYSRSDPVQAADDRRDDMPPAILYPVIEFEQMMFGLVLFSKTRKDGPVGTVMPLAPGVPFLVRDSVLPLSPYLARRINEERTKVLLLAWMPVVSLDDPAAGIWLLRSLKRLHNKL